MPATFVARHWPHARVLARARALSDWDPKHPITKSEAPPRSRNSAVGVPLQLLRAPEADLSKAAVILLTGDKWEDLARLG